jgi:Concanavalin A-like lectin/glucanases superfamily/PEP-CTERM motif
MSWQRVMVFCWAISASALVHADLEHRYSFTSDATDSVGSAHGTLIDGGTATNAVFAGGQLDLSNNTGGSASPGEGAYVNFPNGLISSLASGSGGRLSVELWATVTQTQTWQRYVDFGTSNGGEDTSGSGSDSGYFYISPNSGRWSNGLATETHEPGGPADEVGQTGPLPNNVQLHVVGTYDHNDLTAGPNGTMKLYRDGALIGSGAMADLLDLRTFADNNNWLGRAQWGDPLFKGLFNELRIYGDVLSADAVLANFVAGPDVVIPEPAAATLLLAGLGLVAAARRRAS